MGFFFVVSSRALLVMRREREHQIDGHALVLCIAYITVGVRGGEADKGIGGKRREGRPLLVIRGRRRKRRQKILWGGGAEMNW